VSAPKTVPDALAETLARIARHARPANEVSRREARVRTRAATAMAQRRGVPVAGPVWEAASRSPVVPTEAIHALAAALDARATLIVLSGCAGSGKSVALARAVLLNSRPALLLHASTLSDALRLEADADIDRCELRGRATDATLLAVDDLGAEPEGKAHPALLALLCRRIDAGLITCVSTNLDRVALDARYLDDEHGRLASRFARHGAFCALRAVDLRRQPDALGRDR
jgi:DNA replication protein DnaC